MLSRRPVSHHLYLCPLICFAASLGTQSQPTAADTGGLGQATTLPHEVDETWWHTVQRDIQHSEYSFRPLKVNSELGVRGFEAVNRAQKLRLGFTSEGLHVLPRVSNGEVPPWEFQFKLSSWKSGDVARDMPPSIHPNADGDRIEFVRDGIVEWYRNDERGLEQGFTVEKKLSESGQFRIEMAINHCIRPVLVDDQAIDFLTPNGARVLRFDHLLTVDAAGTLLESWFETCDDEIKGKTFAIVVNDENAIYPIIIDPLATTPSWTGESNQAFAEYGYSVATAGDVNGDGFSDVMVGAEVYANGQSGEGRAFVYHGSSAGLSLIANWTAEPNLAGVHVGYSVAPAGDVNGDGYSDVMIGGYGFDNGELNEGAAYIYYGSAAGLSAAPDWMVEGNQANCGFGKAVASAGDVNGDGFSDVIVGASTYDNGQNDEGRVFVYYGSASGPSTTADWTAEGNQAFGDFGYSVATAGDVNGDGYGDVIVGASRYDFPENDEGRAFVYHGSATGLSSTADWTAESNQSSASFGTSVATAGDVNGDGYSDVVVGAPFYDNGQSNEGRAFVYYGSASGLAATAAWMTESNQPDARLGESVAMAGDVNGDGYADVIIGTTFYDNDQSDEGRAQIFLGSAAGLSSTAAWSAESNQVIPFFGYSVATAGDVNGDGLSDVIVGAPFYDNGELSEGGAFVYLGSSDGPALTPAWDAGGDQDFAEYGYSVSSAGDVNGDGYDDVIVGAQVYANGQAGEGRAFVYYGSASGLSLLADWTAEPDLAGVHLGYSVSDAGDVNGDGFGDLIVGLRGYDNPELNEGAAFVYHGSASGLSAMPDWIAEGNQASASFGTAVSSAGDVNGDGYGDVIIGAPDYDNGQNDEGRAYVYLGSASGLSSTPYLTVEGNQGSVHFGYSVSFAGDVNGDGFSDVIVGAPDYDFPQNNEGRAFVYYGSDIAMSTTADWTGESDQEAARFGIGVSTAGDVNGDGFSDVIVGASRFSNGQNQEGRAYAYYGSAGGLSSTPDWTVESNQVAAWFAESVSNAGDVNGDGFSDVIVGAWKYDEAPEVDEGGVFVYLGSASGLSTTAALIAQGNQTTADLGFSVSAAGDVNGDGFSDVIAGAPYHDNGNSNEGQARVYFGNNGAGRATIPRQLRTNGNTPIAPLGLSDSETKFRIHADVPSFVGQTGIAIQYEVKPFGTLFDGTSLIEDVPTSTDSTGVVSIEKIVTGLSAGTLYHWRVRAKYDIAQSPFQPYGSWIHMPTNGWNEADLRTAGTPAATTGACCMTSGACSDDMVEDDCDSAGGVYQGDGVLCSEVSCPQPCPADLTGPGGAPDGMVDVSDLFRLLANWNTDGAGADLAAPFNVVDVADLFVLLSLWGNCN